MNKRLVWNFEINSENPLKIPKTGIEDIRVEHWESRFFWPENEVIVLFGLDDSFLAVSRYKAKHRQDTYCLLPDTDYNLKIRRNQTLYKPAIMNTPLAVAYGKKINLEKELQAGTKEVDAQGLIARIQQYSRRIVVEKEALIYRFETVPTLKLELARLCVANTVWLSVNLESHSRLLVESVTKQMFGEQQSCDYVTFLKAHCRDKVYL